MTPGTRFALFGPSGHLPLGLLYANSDAIPFSCHTLPPRVRHADTLRTFLDSSSMIGRAGRIDEESDRVLSGDEFPGNGTRRVVEDE